VAPLAVLVLLHAAVAQKKVKIASTLTRRWLGQSLQKRLATYQKLTARWYWWAMKLWNCYDPLLAWSKGFFKMNYQLKQYHKFTLNDNI
jgi:hypothetical protein